MATNDSWEALLSDCRNCHKCGLCETRNNVVVGVGNPNAKLMFVGEAPGRNEDLQGEPFVGAAGQLLDRFLEAVDLHRRDVYIANIVKCRPPENRDPFPEEEEACIPYLRRQFKLISPKIIVCLGRIAGMKLIKPDLKITAERGIWFEKAGIKMMATFHPAALLRDPRRKADVFCDFQTIKELYDSLD